MKYGVVVFPGSNCDHDALHAAAAHTDAEAIPLWHKETSAPKDIDCIILPGGFSYGDYLRSGAIARFSPIMSEVVRLARKGLPIIGICNGFQILTETGLLPGALLRNASLRFVCDDVYLRTETTDSHFTCAASDRMILKIPIAHGEGLYYAEPHVIEQLESERRIAFTYCNSNGERTMESNPNGSSHNIAGILNSERNVLGMMPHPERACEKSLGSSDGLVIFQSIAESCMSLVS